MATQETQVLDEILVSTRRKMLTLGGAALASLAFGSTEAHAQAPAAGPSDDDVLNFALNLEYLEANFYTLATAGMTIDQVGIGIGAGTSAGGPPSVVTKPGGPASCLVPWSATYPQSLLIQAYATETAAEEQTHVTLLRGALGANTVAQPALDLYNSFLALGAAVGVPGFDPFASATNFLLGAYIFEDVGVTAYAGAAASISATATLVTAAGILAVEAYHAGLVRTTIAAIDAAAVAAGNPALLSGITQRISTVRAAASVAADDIGVQQFATPLNGVVTTAQGVSIADVDLTTGLIYTRTPQQVLAVVTGGTASPYRGLFFPSGLNGNIV